MHSNISMPNCCTLAHVPHMVYTVFIIHLEYDIQYKKGPPSCKQKMHVVHSEDTWTKPRNTNSQKLHHKWAALALFLRSQCVFLPVHVIVATFLCTPHFLFLPINFYITIMMIYVTFQNLVMISSRSIQVLEMPKNLLTSNRKAYDYEKTLAFRFNLSFSTGKPQTQAGKHRVLQKYF